MAKFEFDHKAVEDLMEQVGRDHGAKYQAVDQAAREDQQHNALTTKAREAWLRGKLAGQGLPELTNMSGWAEAITSGKSFEIRINVQ